MFFVVSFGVMFVIGLFGKLFFWLIKVVLFIFFVFFIFIFWFFWLIEFVGDVVKKVGIKGVIFKGE